MRSVPSPLPLRSRRARAPIPHSCRSQVLSPAPLPPSAAPAARCFQRLVSIARQNANRPAKLRSGNRHTYNAGAKDSRTARSAGKALREAHGPAGELPHGRRARGAAVKRLPLPRRAPRSPRPASSLPRAGGAAGPRPAAARPAGHCQRRAPGTRRPPGPALPPFPPGRADAAAGGGRAGGARAPRGTWRREGRRTGPRAAGGKVAKRGAKEAAVAARLRSPPLPASRRRRPGRASARIP
ncbi:unnamed protein product, partial [Coccothraustes coccothraustes]